jgi:phosphomannomutase
MRRNLGAIFKAYDIRGTYPDQLDEHVARLIGEAFARYTGAAKVAVGRDMRTSSPALAGAFMEGADGGGASVQDVGQVSTDALYFASGRLDMPACMFTASHNPARYNGLKLCKAQAVPVGSDSGLEEIRALAEEGSGETSPEEAESGRGRSGSEPPAGRGIESVEILNDYATHCRSFVEHDVLRPLRVAIDAGNGMAGVTVPRVFDELPFEVVPLYFELDGTFPNHPANPIEEANLGDLCRAVLESECD